MKPVGPIQKIFSALALAFATCVGQATVVHADALTLSGVATMNKLNMLDAAAVAHLTSSEFDVTEMLVVENWPGSAGCEPCAVGKQVSIGGAITEGPTGFVALGGGTIQGVAYPSLVFGASIRLTGSTIVPPAAFGQTFTVTAPFAASGALAVSHNRNSFPFYTAEVVGTGLATLTFAPELGFPASDPHWDITRAVYEFGNVNPTPEPMTMALFGGGLALTGLRYRRRRDGYSGAIEEEARRRGR
jgi:PEP-CTERM motif